MQYIYSIVRRSVYFMIALTLTGSVASFHVQRAAAAPGDSNDWHNVGAAAFSAGEAWFTSLAIDNGTPYLAYQDDYNNNKATVMKFDGTNWVPVGNTAFSAGEAWYTSLAIDNGVPYVAYADSSDDYRARVMKFDGTNWVPVGGGGFSTRGAWFISLAIDNGVPYVAFQDKENGNKATVMKFDGTNWVPVGGGGFSAGEVDYMSLAMNNGIPYLAYSNEFYGKITVVKFNGTSWVSVGSVGFSAGESWFPSLAIDNGVPYVAFQDKENGNKATVMKFGTNTAHLLNAELNKPVRVTTPTGTNITASSATKESALATQNANYDYPLGLVGFSFTTDFTNNQAVLTFETDLTPDQVVAHKYNPLTNTFSTIPGAIVTSATMHGKPALQLSYTIVDNGALDTDPTIGSITDPVGLALASVGSTNGNLASLNTPKAPNTGLAPSGILSNIAAVIGGIGLLGAMIAGLHRRSHG